MLSLEERIRGYEPFFGKWRLSSLEPMGKGTSGVVFPIQNGEYKAALKIIPIPKDERALSEIVRRCSSETDVRRELETELGYVKSEIETMRLLEGESNIVYFTDSMIYNRRDTYGWDVLICMEKLVRIDHFLKDPKKYGFSFNLELVMRIWSELVDGLCVCERYNIVHFDIKPENIFYAPGKNHFKLGDFGVAVNTRGRQNVMQGGFVGTRDYTSPEMWNRKGGDSRSDIYSLALVIYQLLNHYRLPFMPQSATLTQEDYARAFEMRVTEHRAIEPIKGVKASIMNILLKCLSYEPSQRYSSFAVLKQELMHAIYGGAAKASRANSGKGKQMIVPIVAVAASLGVAGALVAVGVNALRKDDSPVAVPSPVESESAAPELQTKYPTQTVDELATPETAFKARGSFHNYFNQNNQMLSVLHAEISGAVQLYAELDGGAVPVNRVEGVSARDIEGDWSLRESSWPKEGLYFITPVLDMNTTHTLSVEALDENGENLYVESVEFHLEEFDGEVYYKQGDYVETVQAVRFERYGFESVEGGYVAPREEYIFYGTAAPNAQITVYLNSQETRIGSVICDAQGNWSFAISKAQVSGGDRFALLAGYDGEYPVRSAEFIYDGSVSALSINGAILEDSTTVFGNTEENAALELYVGGRAIAQTVADENGYFELDISGSLREGDAYELIATDRVGNVEKLEGTVGHKSGLTPISISLPTEGLYGRQTSITVQGNAEPNEKLEIVAEEIAYRETLSVDKNGAFSKTIALPKDTPAQVRLIVRYKDASEGSVSCLLQFDTMCELSVSEALSIAQKELLLQGEPHASGSYTLTSAQGETLEQGSIACDASGACRLAFEALLLEDDRLTITVEDEMGNAATRELTVQAPADMNRIERVDAEHRVLNADFINTESCQSGGLQFRFKGCGQENANLLLHYGDQIHSSVNFAMLDGVYYFDWSEASLEDGEYRLEISYTSRPDKKYTLDFVLAAKAPEILLEGAIDEGGRTLAGMTSPNSVVTLLDESMQTTLATNYAKQDGSFTLTFAPLKAGDYILQATDAVGNIGQLTFTVKRKTELTIGRADGENSIISAQTPHLDLYGVAEDDREIVLQVDGQVIDRFYASDNAWNYRLDTAYLPEGRSEVSVCYAAGDDLAAALVCEKDSVCRLQVETFDESARAISGVSDPDARLTLIVDGESVATARSSSSGAFEIELAGAVALPLDVEKQMIVRAVDSAGNVAELNVQANKIVRSDITLYIQPQPKNGYINVRKMSVQGSAQADSELTLTLTADDLTMNATVATDASGKYSAKFNISDKFDDGEICLRIAYADGFAQDSNAEETFILDTQAPILHLNSHDLTSGVRNVSGSCGEEAQVWLYINDGRFGSTSANDEGAFSFKNVELHEGDTVYVQARDVAGNAAQSDVEVVKKAAVTAGGSVSVKAGEYSAGDTLRVEGWLGFESVRGVQIRFYHDGELVRGEKLGMNEMTKMSDAELDRALNELPEPITVNKGYTFAKDVVVGTDWPVGEDYDVVIYFDMSPAPVTVYGQRSAFSIAAATPDVDAIDTHVGENYAFGFDAQQPAEAYNSEDIVLSGWVYADATVSGEIGAVQIEALDGSIDPILCDFDEPIHSIDDFDGEQGVYYCERSATAALPDAESHGLGGVTPLDTGAGFIVRLRQDLPNGTYLLSFETTYEGQYEQTISAVIRVDNSISTGCRELAEKLVLAWENELQNARNAETSSEN